jgi:hypothetical protein
LQEGEPTLRPQCDRMMEGLISLGAQQEPSSWVISLHTHTPPPAHNMLWQEDKSP